VRCALVIHEGHEAVRQSLAYTSPVTKKRLCYYGDIFVPKGVRTGGDVPLDLHIRDLAIFPEQSFKVLLGTKFGQITCTKIV
jgi:hypothetical protein